MAATWSERALSSRESPEMLWIHGAALSELGVFNWDRGAPLGSQLLATAMIALDKLVSRGEPALPAKDRFALHAMRADVLSRVGFPGEQQDALSAAERLLETTDVRATDLLRYARVLCREGRFTRAEEIARAALEKTQDNDERLDAMSVLAICALPLGRPEEALSLSAEVLQGTSPGESGRATERRIESERVHIDALFAQGRTTEALAFIDESIQQISWWNVAPNAVPEAALWRLPLFARALRRAGRQREAEAMLRKLLGLPLPGDPLNIGAGLRSEHILRAFMQTAWSPVWMASDMRSKLETELAKALRAQGRHAEADAIKPDLVKLDTL